MQLANVLYPRALKAALNRDLALYSVVAVVGARQVGKSTLCRQIANERGLTGITLDDPAVLEAALRKPEEILRNIGSGGAFVDEAQRAPGLFLAIKTTVDRDPAPGRFLLSGSNQPKMTGGVAESLLGRAAYRTLRPLTLSELRLEDEHRGWDFLFAKEDSTVVAELERREESSGALDWREVVTTGGFPRAVAAPPTQRLRLLDDYVEVFSNRDIREVLGIESPERFERFVRLVGARTGQELNASGLSNDLGIPVNTIRRWIDALTRSYLLELVPAYSRNAGERVIRAPKLFMVDPAFALAAARETAPSGFHLENLVAADLCVWKDGAPERALHHWRLGGGQEVDFVLERARQLLPVEVKAAVAVDNGDARHLRRFRELHRTAARGLLLSCDRRIRILDFSIIAAPWWAVL